MRQPSFLMRTAFGQRAPLLVRRPVGPPPIALRLAAVLAVPLLLYALVATGQKALDNYRLNQDADALRSEIVQLRQENIDLQRKIEVARTDSAIESIARQQLGLIKPGDKPLVIAGSTASAPASPQPAAQPQPPEVPIWRQWWNYFFG
jgi:cell division protein FtsL